MGVLGQPHIVSRFEMQTETKTDFAELLLDVFTWQGANVGHYFRHGEILVALIIVHIAKSHSVNTLLEFCSLK